MSKKNIKRLNKDFYVADEYGHTDEIMVRKINELVEIVNHQQEIIRSFEILLKDSKKRR